MCVCFSSICWPFFPFACIIDCLLESASKFLFFQIFPPENGSSWRRCRKDSQVLIIINIITITIIIPSPSSPSPRKMQQKLYNHHHHDVQDKNIIMLSFSSIYKINHRVVQDERELLKDELEDYKFSKGGKYKINEYKLRLYVKLTLILNNCYLISLKWLKIHF